MIPNNSFLTSLQFSPNFNQTLSILLEKGTHSPITNFSYAGVYVPTLAQQVVLGNNNQNTPLINLKGILVGNGVTDQIFDGNAFPPFASGHALIPASLTTELEQSCDGSKLKKLFLTSPSLFRLLEC